MSKSGYVRIGSGTRVLLDGSLYMLCGAVATGLYDN